MCSKDELVAYLSELPLKKVEVTEPTLVPAKTTPFHTTITFLFSGEESGKDGERYQILIKTKKKEDVHISGKAQCLKGMIDFDIRQESELIDGRYVERFKLVLTCENKDGECLDITTDLRGTNCVSYVALPDPSKVVLTAPSKPKWKGKIRNDGRMAPHPRRQYRKGGGIIRRPPKKVELVK